MIRVFCLGSTCLTSQDRALLPRSLVVWAFQSPSSQPSLRWRTRLFRLPAVVPQPRTPFPALNALLTVLFILCSSSPPEPSSIPLPQYLVRTKTLDIALVASPGWFGNLPLISHVFQTHRLQYSQHSISSFRLGITVADPRSHHAYPIPEHAWPYLGAYHSTS